MGDSTDETSPRPVTFASWAPDAFVLPFLARRGDQAADWPPEARRLPRLALDRPSLQLLSDVEMLGRPGGATSLRALAEQHQMATTTLHTQHERARRVYLVTAYILFSQPSLFNLVDLLRARGRPATWMQLYGRADAICHVFDDTRPVRFEPRFPLRVAVAGRYPEHHRELLRRAAVSLDGPALPYLLEQGATGVPASIDLRGRLDRAAPQRRRAWDESGPKLADEIRELDKARSGFWALCRSRLEEGGQP